MQSSTASSNESGAAGVPGLAAPALNDPRQSGTQRLRVVIADDYVAIRQSVRGLLKLAGHEVVGEAEDGQEAVRLVRRLAPDIAILDLAMPRLNGEETVRQIRRWAPGVKTVVLTSHDDRDHVMRAMRAGAKAYVLKIRAAEELLHAMAAVADGRVFVSPGMEDVLVAAVLEPGATDEDPLTSRERQALQLIAEGHTTRRVAELMCIEIKTAETHRNNIMRKLAVHDAAGLVRYAIRRGLRQA